MAHLIFSALPQPRRPIVFANVNTSVVECIRIMTEEDIGALVIVDENILYGLLSERDIVRACFYRELNTMRAGEIAYKDVEVLNLFDPVENAMEIITQTKRRHVLIEDEGEIMAILSIGDVLCHLLEEKTRVIEQLENYIHTY